MQRTLAMYRSAHADWNNSVNGGWTRYTQYIDQFKAWALTHVPYGLPSNHARMYTVDQLNALDTQLAALFKSYCTSLAGQPMFLWESDWSIPPKGSIMEPQFCPLTSSLFMCYLAKVSAKLDDQTPAYFRELNDILDGENKVLYRAPFTIHHFYRQLFEIKSRMQSINPLVDSAAIDLRIFNRLKTAIEFTPWSSADPYGLKWIPIATSMHNFRSQIGAPPHLDFYATQWSSLNSLARTIADAERIVDLGMSSTWQNFGSGSDDSTPASSIDLLLQQNRQLTSGMHTTFVTGIDDHGDADVSDGEDSVNDDEVAYLTALLDAAEVYIGAGAASPRGYVHKEPKLR